MGFCPCGLPSSFPLWYLRHNKNIRLYQDPQVLFSPVANSMFELLFGKAHNSFTWMTDFGQLTNSCFCVRTNSVPLIMPKWKAALFRWNSEDRLLTKMSLIQHNNNADPFDWCADWTQIGIEEKRRLRVPCAWNLSEYELEWKRVGVVSFFSSHLSGSSLVDSVTKRKEDMQDSGWHHDITEPAQNEALGFWMGWEMVPFMDESLQSRKVSADHGDCAIIDKISLVPLHCNLALTSSSLLLAGSKWPIIGIYLSEVSHDLHFTLLLTWGFPFLVWRRDRVSDLQHHSFTVWRTGQNTSTFVPKSDSVFEIT